MTTIDALIFGLGSAVEVGNLYDAGGADVYEALTGDDSSELAEFVCMMRGRRTAVLELGCGSGRITVPLLALGFHVVGVDVSSSMLAIMSSRALALPQRMRGHLEIVDADMSSLSLQPRRFGAVILGATTVSLLGDADRRSTLRLSAGHLESDGIFFVSNLELDDGDEWTEDVQVTVRRLPTIGPATITVIESIQSSREHREVGVLVQPVDRARPMTLYRTRPRIVSREHLLQDLSAAGLAVVNETRHTVSRRRRSVCIYVCRREVVE